MRYIVPFIPFIIICAIGFIGLLSSAIKENRQQREAERRRAERAEAAARAKAEREAKKAEAACATEAAQMPKRKRGRPRKVQPAPDPVRPETVSAAPFKGNNMFAGQIVAFTGTLKDMTRAEAIKAVEANGGKAFDTMPTSTTLLVVGEGAPYRVTPKYRPIPASNKWQWVMHVGSTGWAAEFIYRD